MLVYARSAHSSSPTDARCLSTPYLGSRLVAWESPILGQVAGEAAVVHCLTRRTKKPSHLVRCESVAGFKVSNAAHPSRARWPEYGDTDPKRLVKFFETFRLNRMSNRLVDR